MDTRILALVASALATMAFYRLYQSSCVSQDDEGDIESITIKDATFYKFGLLFSGFATIALGFMIYRSNEKETTFLTEPFDTFNPSETA